VTVSLSWEVVSITKDAAWLNLGGQHVAMFKNANDARHVAYLLSLDGRSCVITSAGDGPHVVLPGERRCICGAMKD
jgi:hypothetical protein